MNLGGLLKKIKVTLRRDLQKNPAKLQFTKEFLVIWNPVLIASDLSRAEQAMIAKQRKQADRQAKQSKAIKKGVKSESRNIRASEWNKSLKWRQVIRARKVNHIEAKRAS